MSKVKITIMLESEVERDIKNLAKKEERPISYQINKILKEYIERDKSGK